MQSMLAGDPAGALQVPPVSGLCPGLAVEATPRDRRPQRREAW